VLVLLVVLTDTLNKIKYVNLVIQHVQNVLPNQMQLVHRVRVVPILTIILALLIAQPVNLEIVSLEHVNPVTLDALHVKVEILLNVMDVM
jgi:hypothetical protein